MNENELKALFIKYVSRVATGESREFACEFVMEAACLGTGCEDFTLAEKAYLKNEIFPAIGG